VRAARLVRLAASGLALAGAALLLRRRWQEFERQLRRAM